MSKNKINLTIPEQVRELFKNAMEEKLREFNSRDSAELVVKNWVDRFREQLISAVFGFTNAFGRLEINPKSGLIQSKEIIENIHAVGLEIFNEPIELTDKEKNLFKKLYRKRVVEEMKMHLMREASSRGQKMAFEFIDKIVEGFDPFNDSTDDEDTRGNENVTI